MALAHRYKRPEAWNHPHSDRAIRVLVDEDLPFYHLAVKQAEALYGARSPRKDLAASCLSFEVELNQEDLTSILYRYIDNIYIDI